MNDLAKNLNSAPLIILFHGLSSSPLEFNFLSSQLTASGYRVATPVITGYSFGGNASSWKFWLSEALEQVQRFQAEEELPVSIDGISLGSTLALAVAAQSYGLQGVISLSTTLKYNGWAVPWYRSLIPLGMILGLGDRFKYREREPFGIKNKQIRAYIKKVLSSDGISAIGGLYMSLRHMYEGNKLCRHTMRNLSQVTPPILTIHAIDDEIANSDNAKIVGELSNAPLKRQIYLGNSYHMITVDNERETVASEVISFLDRIYGNPNGDHFNDKIISPELQRFLRNQDRNDSTN